MTQTLMIVPAREGVGLTSATMGLVRKFNESGINIGFVQCIAQRDICSERLKTDISHEVPAPLSNNKTEKLLAKNKRDEILEHIVEMHAKVSKETDVVIVLGLIATPDYPYSHSLNISIAEALSAEIIIVGSPDKLSPSEFSKSLSIAAKPYQRLSDKRILGYLINKIGENTHQNKSLNLIQKNESVEKEITTFRELEGKTNYPILGYIPWDPILTAPRVKEIVSMLDAKTICEGNMEERRVFSITLCARHVSNMLDVLQPGALIITPADRSDIIIATAMAVLNGTKIAALLLTGDYDMQESVMKLCERAVQQGLPILKVNTNSFDTANNLQKIDFHIPADDLERMEASKNHIASHIEYQYFENWLQTQYEKQFSPPAFRYYLLDKARSNRKKIILPEGDEPRIILAALQCQDKNIADCILLGNKENIEAVCSNEGMELNPELTIIDPETIQEKYVDELVKLRSHKGLTEVQARDSLQDNIVLATMMLAVGDVDGMVAGAINTTANTIRPALQLIKTAEKVKLVSSIFFMCLPSQVLVYGDCAVNPNPDPEALADIAIQSARTAEKFGLSPRIAMISYSTGDSGMGSDVEKVKTATKLVRKQAPDLLVDGPLQYDAALIQKVAEKKAPSSNVAGRANVFIFPDLNTGNTTYKAVQRSGNVLCIGPVLQGLNKPVNDLSRGALVDDIVYTIALTAVQAD